MARSQQHRFFTTTFTLALGVLAGIFGLTMLATPAAQAQTYRVLHNFTGGSDGADPQSTLAIDRAGNLYGTASDGGTASFGTVYKLSRYGSNFIFNPLYNFQGQYDGAFPLGPVTLAADGTLYGTTLAGGNTVQCGDGGCGVVFRLTPPATTPPSPFTPWRETVLHAFEGLDGAEPVYPQLFLDRAGNLYGTTQFGGSDFGVVFEMTPSGGAWTESVLYGGFNAGSTGEQPYGGVVMDSAGNLYGTTSIGGNGGEGVVYEISPTPNGWIQTILHYFRNGDDGGLSFGGLIIDQAGNLYGGTVSGGTGDCGLIYELSPSNGSWTFQVLYDLPRCGGGPYETLTLDAAGNLYGTAFGDGAGGGGMVYKLSKSNGVWTLTDLHDFDFDTAYFPYGGVTLDASDNLFGTASGGGVYGHGVVWEITP